MKKVLKWIIIIISIFILIILYARYIGTSGFNTDEYTIYDNNLPNSFDGLKIVHFSDIHYNRAINIDKINKIVDEINLINPDIVVFTGDLIDKDMDLTKKDYDNLAKNLSKIKAKISKYAIVGEDDEEDIDKVTSVFEQSGFVYLDNSSDIIYKPDSSSILIGGTAPLTYDKDDIDKTINDSDISYKIILIHEPDIAKKIKGNYQVNLILAGHTHGGQIRLPYIGAIYNHEYAKEYHDNYYNLDGANFYISSGIGVSTINYRLWNRPSINLYRIYKEKED